MSIAPTKLASVIYFRTSARNLVEAAEVLRELGETPIQHASIRDRVGTLEDAGDELVHRLLAGLDSESSLTPRERADLYGVGRALDAVIDDMEAAATLAHIHAPAQISWDTAELVDIVATCAELVAEAIAEIGVPHRITKLATELRRLAGTAEAIVATAEPVPGDSSAAFDDINEQLLTVVHAFCAVAHSATGVTPR